MSTKDYPSPINGQLSVDVRDLADQPLANATVIVKPLLSKERARKTARSKTSKGRKTKAGAKEVTLKYDRTTRTYTAQKLTPGPHEVYVSSSGMEAQSREVMVQPGGSDELFILGKQGLPSYFRGKVRVPFEADPALISVTLRRGISEKDKKALLTRIAKGNDLEPKETPELAQRARMQLFRVAKAGAKATRDVLGKLREDPDVEHAGSVVKQRGEGFTHLTDEVVVQFKPHVTEKEAYEIARKLNFSVVRNIPYSPNSFHLRSLMQAGSVELLGVIEQLAKRDEVEWAEPNLVQSPELDTITPPDVLWQGCWDRQLIGCGDAWQHLQDAGLETYGEPGVIIAVLDSGTQSAGGTPTNPDLQGTVSDGSTKVYQVFDFENMVPNNDAPWDPHGSGVTCVVSARAADPAPIPGQSSGVVGSAPNCRIMTIEARVPYVDTELADMFIWVAGFNPNSPLVGFPPPISPGADITTSSLGIGGGPLSGTGQAMIDFLTSFGRGGKGCMCFFSTGNNNLDNTIARPYSAHQKSFGIAATTYDNDGATEIRAPYSGHGKIALCAPSHDNYPVFHNPNGSFATWGGAHAGTGNLISYRAIESTLTAASVAGANTLSLASVAGLAMNQVIHVGTIGMIGSEPARITAVNAMTNTINVNGWTNAATWSGGLINAHAAGDPVAQGPPNHKNNFGGTSSATPLTAGAAALVLSADPDLTWIEVRQILRDTAVKFDLANVDPVGRWLDADGNPSTVSGLPPVRSAWYGYGRVDADAAVQTAITIGSTTDIVVRDNLVDDGSVASVGAYWNSPDIWVRNDSPAMEGAAALPANYTIAGPHLNAIAGQPNWIYARVKNNGSAPSLDCFVRISLTHWPGLEFTYPTSFIPTTRPGDPIPSPMTPGTYLIGEVKISGLGPGADQIVNVQWPTALIPPEDVMVGMTSVHWHPCLLVECSPLDGPTTGGNHVWDSNSLAQKNISIVYTDSSTDFGSAMVVGNEENLSEYLILEIARGYLPREVRLYVDLVNPILKRRLRSRHDYEEQKGDVLVTELTLGRLRRSRLQSKPFVIGHHKGTEVCFLTPRAKVQIPIYGGAGSLHPVVVGGIVGKGAKPGEYSVTLVQRDPKGDRTGSAEISVRIRK